jgi:superfamily II DNA or RNA helicase
VLIVVPTVALIDQWAVALEEDLGLRPADLGLYAEGNVPQGDEAISVLTLVAAREHVPRLAEGRATLLIVDECHRIGSPVNSLALKGQFAETLGLSATPEREHDEGFEELIVPALGDVIFEYGYDDARMDGVISPFDLVNVEVPLLPHEAERYETLSKRASRLFGRHRRGDDVEEQLGRTLQERARVAARAMMRIPVAVRLLDRHRGVRALVFHEFIDAAEEIQEQLAARNHSVTIYHSNLAPAHRQENLRMYRRGMFDVLVTCRALDEGVNLPETELAIVASGTASRRQRIQRLGRVLRPAAGKERALIYTLYATGSERDRLAAEEQGGVSGAETIRWMRSG